MLKVTISKPTADINLGFRLQKNAEGEIYFSQISPGSVLDGTVLHEGMLVCLVNGINCQGQSLTFVSTIIRDTEGALQLGVRNPLQTTTNDASDKNLIQWDDQSVDLSCTSGNRSIIPTWVTPIDDDETSTLVCVSKMKRMEDSVGLRLRVSSRDNVTTLQIDRVVPDGIFGDSALRTGMILLRVNGMDVNGWPVKDVLDVIRFTDGMLTLEAEKIGKNPGKFSVCMQKIGSAGKVVTNQVAKLNKKQWGMILKAGFVVLMEMNGVSSD